MADSKQPANDEIKSRVRKLQRQIVSDVDPDAVSDWLLEEKIITVEQWQTIRANNTTRCSRCRALLLDLYSNSHPKTFLVLLNALEEEAHHIWESIVSQSQSTSGGLKSRNLNSSNDQHYDLEEKIQQLLLKQKNFEETCSDLGKKLEAEKEKHRQEKENMDRAWKEEKSQLLQKQNQLEQRISELEDLLHMGKRKISVEKKDEHSTSPSKTKSEITPLSEIQPSEQFQPCDISLVKQVKQFFSNKGNAEPPANQRKPQISPKSKTKTSLWERRHLDQQVRESTTTNNERSPKCSQEQMKTKSPQLLNSVPEDKSPTVRELLNGQKTSKPLTPESQAATASPNPPFNSETDSISYQPIRTKAAVEQNKAITGLTILDKELFIVSRLSSEVEVYDSTKLSFSRRWELAELVAPVDIGSCKRIKCLYIMHEKGSGQTTEILRVDRNGVLSKRWPTGQDYGYSISVTDESNIIVCVFHKNKLVEYSPEGQLIREVGLAVESGLVHPSHALKLTSGQFLVCHGTRNDIRHRVCIVDSAGKLKNSFSEKNGSVTSGMNRPAYLAVDGSGLWMVVDQWNSRVLSLDCNLKFNREILSKERHGLRRPSRILLDESNGRLLVTDNEWNTTKLILIDGRILIFNHNC